MMRDEGRRILCPTCGSFIAKVMSVEGEVEVNCAQSRCGATVVIVRNGEKVAVEATSKQKRA